LLSRGQGSQSIPLQLYQLGTLITPQTTWPPSPVSGLGPQHFISISEQSPKAMGTRIEVDTIRSRKTTVLKIILLSPIISPLSAALGTHFRFQ